MLDVDKQRTEEANQHQGEDHHGADDQLRVAAAVGEDRPRPAALTWEDDVRWGEGDWCLSHLTLLGR
jgi:hypothetical protein